MPAACSGAASSSGSPAPCRSDPMLLSCPSSASAAAVAARRATALSSSPAGGGGGGGASASPPNATSWRGKPRSRPSRSTHPSSSCSSSSSASESRENPSDDAVTLSTSVSTKSSSSLPHPSAMPSSRSRAPRVFRPTTRPHGRSRTGVPPPTSTHIRTVLPRGAAGPAAAVVAAAACHRTAGALPALRAARGPPASPTRSHPSHGSRQPGLKKSASSRAQPPTSKSQRTTRPAARLPIGGPPGLSQTAACGVARTRYLRTSRAARSSTGASSTPSPILAPLSSIQPSPPPPSPPFGVPPKRSSRSRTHPPVSPPTVRASVRTTSPHDFAPTARPPGACRTRTDGACTTR
mmetsp:Transcript_10939/g.32109  ORF Transcript_10939/g.32109 Transcript_10939/m.32109 type:complete len:350 (+) Transcript_10939:945-1994(+)